MNSLYFGERIKEVQKAFYELFFLQTKNDGFVVEMSALDAEFYVSTVLYSKLCWQCYKVNYDLISSLWLIFWDCKECMM